MDGDKNIYYFDVDKDGKLRLTKVVKKKEDLYTIWEENEENEKGGMEYKYKYFEELIKNNKIKRAENRYSGIQDDKISKTNTMLVKDFHRPKNYTEKLSKKESTLKRSKIEELQETEKKEESNEKHDRVQELLKKNDSEVDLIENLKDSYNLDTKNKDE